MYHGSEGMMFGMGWWWIIGLIVIVAVVWAVVKSMNTNNSSNPPPGKSALDILKERYARGEINKDELEEKKKSIS